MVFSSVLFLMYFLPILLGLYFLVPRNYKNALLLIFSLYFYAWGEPIYIWLMIVSIAANYFFGLKVHPDYKTQKQRKFWLVITVIFNVGLLCVFKYTNFFLANVTSLLQLPVPVFHIPLPLGISFFTFQAMSYVMDVYRKEAKYNRSIIDIALYVTLFPQLVAGPIVRYQTIADQIIERQETPNQFVLGIKHFIIGLAKKILIANTLGMAADQVFSGNLATLSMASAWLGIICYGMQIYYDFCGYSEMAIGLGFMFGFHFMANFNYPYISKSVAEFWRRWHISLGTWFRDYVYIPLGGNRCGVVKQVRNLSIVWLLTGVWHGASWNFIFWGLYFGFWIMLENFVLKGLMEKLPAIVRHLYLLLVVFVGWVFFRLETLTQAFRYLQVLFVPSAGGFADGSTVFIFRQYGFELMLALLFSAPFIPWLRTAFSGISLKKSTPYAIFSSAAYMILFMAAVLQMVNSSFNPFIYFRF